MFCSVETEIHLLRLLLKKNTVQMSRMTGVPQATISAFEREAKPLPHSTIEKYVRYIYKSKPNEKILLHTFDSALAPLLDCPEFYTACRSELIHYFLHLPFLLKEDPPNILPGVANFVKLTFVPKRKLITTITSSDQKDNQRMFHILINFIVTNSEFISPSSGVVKFNNLADFYDFISTTREFSIPSPRRRVDFYHLCFCNLTYSNDIPIMFEITGVSGNVYKISTFIGFPIPSNALTGFNI